MLGVSISVDECTATQRRVTYARILVEVDVSKPLPKSIMVEDENGKVYDQAFFIEWIPHFCQKCQTLGHICGEGRLTQQGGQGNNRRM